MGTKICKPVKLCYDLLQPKGGADEKLSPLLFLHGALSSRDVAWLDIPQRISDKTKRKVYNLDARNHGDSEWSDEFDFDVNAVDLLHFIDHMGFRKVVLVGHSMGGIASIKAALKEPKLFEKVILEDIFLKKIPQHFLNEAFVYLNLWREVEKLIPPEFNKEEADHFITNWIEQKTKPGSHPPSDSKNRVHYAVKKDSTGRYSFTPNLEVIFPIVKDAELLMSENEGIYDGPSYFLYGTKSPYKIDKEKYHILKHFPQAVFIPFETRKHCVHREFPDLFVNAVSKCINENEKNSGEKEINNYSRISN